MNLPYYDSIRFSIIDPMHNLFLGTARRVLHQWLESDLLSHADLQQIQQRVDRCLSSGSIGRIPRKIALEFSNLTADEWKNWTILFSLIALFDVLPPEHLHCWQLYVLACNILSSSIISQDDIDEAHHLLSSFFTTAEELYGSKFLTINAYLHLHLQDVYRDYGPCYGYWLFSFERYNGLLGKIHTNQLSIEIQLMRRFIENMYIRSLASSDILASDSTECHSLFYTLLNSKAVDASSETIFDQKTFLSGYFTAGDSLDNIAFNCPVKLLPPSALYLFDNNSFMNLKACYAHYLPDVDLLEIPQLCSKYTMAQWWSHHLRSSKHTEKFTCILADWIGSDGRISENNSLCAGRIEYFLAKT